MARAASAAPRLQRLLQVLGALVVVAALALAYASSFLSLARPQSALVLFQQRGAPRSASAAAAASAAAPVSSSDSACLLRRRLFPDSGALNPARAAWRRASLDWHDLVPATSTREARDRAKSQLLRLLQNFDAPAALRESCGVGGCPDDAAAGSTQAQLVTLARAELSSASGDDWRALARLVGNATWAARKATALGLDAEDLSALRVDESAHGPLAKFQACGRVRDACILHATMRACVDDAWCGWCEHGGGLCVSRLAPVRPNPAAGQPQAVCASRTLIVAAESVPSFYRGPPSRVSRLVLRSRALRLRLEPMEPAACSFIVTRRSPLLLTLNDGNSRMAFHFVTETLPSWYQDAQELHGGTSHLLLDVFAPLEVVAAFPAVASAFSDSCPHVVEETLVLLNSTVICYAELKCEGNGKNESTGTVSGDGPVSATSAFGLPAPALARVALTHEALRPLPSPSSLLPPLPQMAPDVMLEPVLEAIAKGKRLGLRGLAAVAVFADPEAGPPLARRLLSADRRNFAGFLLGSLLLLDEDGGRGCGRPLVTFISRQEKRFVLNEPELVRVAVALGARVRVAALEDMALYEQLRLFRQSDVLVGMHGSGLINTFFMRKGAALLQLVPLGLRGANSFFEPTAAAAGVRYFELEHRGLEGVVPHAHFLDRSAGDAAALLTNHKGSDAVSQKVFFSFWINQDISFSAHAFAKALRDMLRSAPRSEGARDEGPALRGGGGGGGIGPEELARLVQ